ncbi:MAG: UDP-N-acetylmuramate dehydrogenase [Pyrinomonadaceae bacterium]
MSKSQETKPDFSSRDRIIEHLSRELNIRAERGRRFAELTSLRVGGNVDWLLLPATEEDAAAITWFLDESRIPWRVLGAGSNVLADDADHQYVLISTRKMKGEARFSETDDQNFVRVSVSCGYSLPKLCVDAWKHRLSGIEGLGGIPGTVGGAIWMNAGAYEQEIGGVVETVRVARTGTTVEVPGRDVVWEYRRTSFNEGELLLGVTLRLKKDDPRLIKERMDEAKKKRLETQPHSARSAGCFFKNPPNSGLSAGRMIDEMGFKGVRQGGALVSSVHANFIVTEETEGKQARAEDALALAEEIRERVRREHGIELEYEVEIWPASSR